MFTSNKIFADSSILVEALKGNKVQFYRELVSDITNEIFINETVVSEYLYFVLGFTAGVSPRSTKERNLIGELLSTQTTLTTVLKDFSFASGSSSILELAPNLMATYNLLPNDAIILATCKIHNISKLASHDSDFILPCAAEGIELLKEEE